MDFLNHITLTTGHLKKTYPNEVDKELYFILSSIRNDIFNGGAKIRDKYTAKGTYDPENGSLITVFGFQGEPILTIGITKYKKSSIWSLLHDTCAIPVVTKPQFPPKAPYIADRLEIGALTNMDALKWTGDFSKCMGWICLAPEKIR